MTVSLGLNMAFQTLFKAVLFGSNSLVHGFIPLMQDEIHVVFAHDPGRLYALLTFCSRNNR